MENYVLRKYENSDYEFVYEVKKNAFVLPFVANYEADFLLKNHDKTKSAKKTLILLCNTSLSIGTVIACISATNK